MSDLKNPEYFLKQNDIEVDKLKEEKPMFFNNIIKAMSFYAEHYHILVTEANGDEQGSEQCNIGNVNVSVSDNIEYYQENNVHENGCSITSGIISKTER